MKIPLKLMAIGLLALSAYGAWVLFRPAPTSASHLLLNTSGAAPAVAQDGRPAEPPKQAASPAMGEPLAPRPSPPPGAENYGEQIRQAAESDNPQAWLKAAQQISACGSVARSLDFIHAEKSAVPAELGKEAIESFEAEARRCQTVTAQQQAMQVELYRKAIQHKVPGAAYASLGSLGKKPTTPADKSLLLEGLRSEAATGHSRTLLHLAIFGKAQFGLSAIERRSYVLAVQAIGSKSEQEKLKLFTPLLLSDIAKELPAAQEAEAATLANNIVAKRRPT